MGPDKLSVRVLNVAGDAIAGAEVEIKVQKGADLLDLFARAAAPRQVALKTGFSHVTLTITAPLYFAESAVLSFGGPLRWQSTNAAWKLTESGNVAQLDVVVGRVRFAKVVSLPK